MSHPLRVLSVTRFVIVVFALGVVGCARPMALSRAALSLEDKPIAIFTLRTSNQFVPIYRPEVLTVELVPMGSKRGPKFKVKRPFRQSKKEFYEYLISVDSKPGTYTIGRVFGRSMFPNNEFFALIYGVFKFPLNLQFDLEPNSIVYLGHVSMTNRKRAKGERRSGLVVPLVDQAVSGFAGGTFDISVSDRYDLDVADFVKAYPALLNFEIKNRVHETTSRSPGDISTPET